MKKDTIGVATTLALSTAFISGVSLFVNKFAVTAAKDPILFTTLKNSLVAIFLVGIMIGLGRFREIRSLSGKQWLKLFVIGAVGGALPFALFFTGLAETTAVNGALIHKTLFLWVTLMAIPFLKEKMVWQQWTGVALIFLGNLFVGGFTGFKFNTGEMMILAATILWAIENIVAKKALNNISSVTVGAARMVIGSALLVLYISIFGKFGPVFSLTSAQWGWTFLTGVLLAGYVLTWYSALKRAPATYVATLLVPATLVTNILSALFITHALAGRDLASAFLYSVGVFLLIFFARKTTSYGRNYAM
jgi:drug/metabolite transporter (DMT)-like permease